MGVLKQASYEDARQKRLEENKRRLEELGLSSMSKSIAGMFKKTKVFTLAQRSPSKPRNNKSTLLAELRENRRSSRLAQKPAAVYKDMDAEDLSLMLRRSSVHRGANIRRQWCTYVSDQARDAAADTASSIETSYPSFVKRMLPSHVSSCFWLGLPLSFCKAHLPKTDQYMKLINGDGEEWESLYLARKTGLSAGWKRFAEENELRDGDALLFELVQYNQFNVHIVRVTGYEEKAEDKSEDEGGHDEHDEEEYKEVMVDN